ILSLALNDGRVASAMSHPWLLWLGAISYSVYLSHMLLLSLINVTSAAIFGKTIGRFLDTGSSLLVLAGLLAVVLALSTGFMRMSRSEPAAFCDMAGLRVATSTASLSLIARTVFEENWLMDPERVNGGLKSRPVAAQNPTSAQAAWRARSPLEMLHDRRMVGLVKLHR
ncbi:hypothetical protein, partial [Ralstonia pseudosolanacearum]|uniref:hypothetical protein n=1 Tax=Ralstonia pseudosolanacearum TaxID=1310165 RepID=UPI003CF04D75